jgi:hypothetical protein
MEALRIFLKKLAALAVVRAFVKKLTEALGISATSLLAAAVVLVIIIVVIFDHLGKRREKQ